jgi:hypothetical protein
VAILALAVPFIVYIVTRPKLRLSVSNAEVGAVQETGTFAIVEIVAHNDGGRTARIEDWRVTRYRGTDRENLWRTSSKTSPGDWPYTTYDSKKWRAELLSRGRVNLHAEEAWSDVDITVTYQPFFFLEPETISHHNKLGVWKPAEGT